MARLDLTNAARVVYTAPDEILAEIDRSSLLALLSDDERERHARFHFDHDRDGYLVAHALTRRLLAEVAGVDARALTFIANEHGRPELCSPRAALPFRFNLSHTRGLVACGVTRAREIGIDVERIDREVELLAVARHVFSPREIGELERMLGEAQRRRFFELWTLKEAYVKAIGKGLAAPLRSISFAPGPHDPVPVHFDPEANDDASTWSFRRHTPRSPHRMAIALRADASAAIRFDEIGASRLLGSLLE